MLLWLFRPLRYLTRIFTAEESPRQLALGLALGLVVGLVPKGNLTAVLLATVLFATRVSLGSGVLTATLASLVAPLLDPLTHRIGWKILTLPAVRSELASWLERRLVAWTALNNTVVLGSVVLGAALFYPAYHVSKAVFQRFPPASVLAASRQLVRRGSGRRPESVITETV